MRTKRNRIFVIEYRPKDSDYSWDLMVDMTFHTTTDGKPAIEKLRNKYPSKEFRIRKYLAAREAA